MREIEFRVWSKSYKEIVKVDLLGKNKVLSSRTWFDFNDIELMQYTGLKDKNGVKIFEGDIVKFTTGPFTSIGIVKFYDGMFVVEDIEDDECTEILCYCDELEVLGNCWENPELLEVE